MKLNRSQCMFSPPADPSAIRNISAAKPVTAIRNKLPSASTWSTLDLVRMRYGRCT